jgi:hypothetical protein
MLKKKYGGESGNRTHPIPLSGKDSEDVVTCPSRDITSLNAEEPPVVRVGGGGGILPCAGNLTVH